MHLRARLARPRRRGAVGAVSAWQWRHSPKSSTPVGVDAEPGQALDLGDGVVEARVGDLGRPPAARADDVMVMRAGARDVGMIATREIEPLHHAELDEQIQGAEQGRPTHAEAPVAGDRRQLGRREVPVVGGDQVGERQRRGAVSRYPASSSAANDRVGVEHRRDGRRAAERFVETESQ